MFEKEAEERSKEIRSESWFKEGDYYSEGYYSEGYCEGYEVGFHQGVEFGYNKAKEEIEKLRELVSDCLFYCNHIDPYYNECLTEDNIFERAKKLGINEE